MQRSGQWADRPTLSDQLGFTDYRRTLVKVILEAGTPITLGIFGTWGSGKTSLMQMLRQDLQQNPLRLSDDLDDTELPQPDVMLVKNQLYVDHPKPADVLLLVEVSDSTLSKDRTLKLPLYAQVGIPEVWIVNLVQRRIEVCTGPKESDYQCYMFHDLTAGLAPNAFPDTQRQWLPEDIHTLLNQQQNA